MANQTLPHPSSLYETDETAWLEKTANLVTQKRFSEIDSSELSEYLLDMARRDRREVSNRLVTLLAHLLTWEFQSKQRSKSCHLTILHQRQNLEQLLESGTLEKHASEVLARTYQKAIQQATIETGLPESAFPQQCALSLHDILNRPLN